MSNDFTERNLAILSAYERTQRKHKSRQPSKALKRDVRAAFDADALKRTCARDSLDFCQYATRHDLEPGKDGHDRFYYYQDNGSDVLAIAHLDTVQRVRTCQVVETNAGLLALSGALDDRLGAYVILDMLPLLGVTCDWLLTTDEEACDSTAEMFFPDKQYNWMFQFDRGGSDVVMYQYDTPELRELVENAGAVPGIGSFSDIAVLDHLGCSGLNWGVGYQDYHGPKAHAWLEETFRMVARFVKFYRANHATLMPYRDTGPSYRRSIGWDDDDDTGQSYVEYWATTPADAAIVVADCGHEVDLADERTFRDIPETDRIECADCADPYLPADLGDLTDDALWDRAFDRDVG